MPESAVRALSVGVIKAILQQNHVRLGAGVLEKSELVARVLAVVDDERQERAQQQQQQPRANQPSAEENHDVDMDAGHQVDPDVPMANATPPPTIVEETKAEVKPLPPKAQAMAAHLERTGLCVICQVRHLIFAVATHELNVLGVGRGGEHGHHRLRAPCDVSWLRGPHHGQHSRVPTMPDPDCYGRPTAPHLQGLGVCSLHGLTGTEFSDMLAVSISTLILYNVEQSCVS
jgi:hypothetical protein